MNKRIFFASILLTLSSLTHGQQISDNEALEIASTVLDKSVVKAVPQNHVALTNIDGGSESTQPYFNIYTGEDGEGFVFVSTDRRAPRVIGYGEGKCNPNNLPPQLVALFSYQDSVLKNDTSLPEHSSWQKDIPRLSTVDAEGKVLKTANFHQWEPYNRLAPVGEFGDRCATGCSPTALAIVMKYHNWPPKGNGQNSYNWRGQELSFDFETDFDWDNILEDYIEGEYTEENANAVANLMYACGVALEANFGQGETSAVMETGYNLNEHFIYSPKAGRIDNYYIKDEKIYDIIKNEIEHNRPMLMSIVPTSSKGHVVVVDGYGDSNIVHLNFGWGGYANGYYELFNTEGYIASWDEITVGIEPVEQYTPMDVQMFAPLMVNRTDIHVDQPFYISGGDVEISEKVRRLCINWTDENNNVKKVLEEYKNDSKIRMGIGFGNQLHTLTDNEIQPGDKIQVMYKNLNSTEWKTVSSVEYIPSAVPLQGNEVACIDINYDIYPPDLDFKWYYGSEWGEMLDDEEAVPVINSRLLLSFENPDPEAKTYVAIKNRRAGGAQNTNLWRFEYGKQMMESITMHYREADIRIKRFKPEQLIEAEVTIEEPGTLAAKINELFSDPDRIRSLKIKGGIYNTDIKVINDLIAIEKLDLGEAYVYDDFTLINENIDFLVLPKNLEMISVGTITCPNLRTITLPEKLWCIDDLGVYMYHRSPYIVTLNPIPPMAYQNSFIETGFFKDMILYVPQGCVDIYREHPYWSQFGCIREINGDLTYNLNIVNQDGLLYLTNEKNAYLIDTKSDVSTGNLSIPQTVKVGNIDIPVTYIGRFTEDIYIPDYSNLEGTKEINVPKDVDFITESAFVDFCHVNQFAVSPENVTFQSNNGAIYDCDMKKLIAFPEGKNVESFYIPEGVESINTYIYSFHVRRLMLPSTLNCCRFINVSSPLDEIYTFAENPPRPLYSEMFNDPQIFNLVNNNATLYVPIGCKDVYTKDPYWGIFNNIQEFDPAYIESVIRDSDDKTTIQVFDISGKRLGYKTLNQITKSGIYLVKHGDKVEKIVIR